MVNQLTSQKAQMPETTVISGCVVEGASRDCSTNNVRVEHRLMSHKERLFNVSKRYFAGELSVGVEQAKSKKDER